MKKHSISQFLLLFLGCFCSILYLGASDNEYRSKYFIALKKNDGSIPGDLTQFSAFLPPPNMLYADPMLFQHNGITYLFFEEYDYTKGTIAYVTIDDSLTLSEPARVLELPQHLSFPYVFKDGNAIFMTPETFHLKEVSLYEALDFPRVWGKKRVLISGENYADPMLFFKDGYYWLFVAANLVELCIFYAENLTTEFKPHPINKLKLHGRNAGGVFVWNNCLIRPVMDCSKIYGGAMILKEIVRLDPENFEERELCRIDPTWAPGLNGTHTYSVNDNIIAYDGRRRILHREDALYSSPYLTQLADQ